MFARFFKNPSASETNQNSLIKQVKFINGTPTLEYEDDEFEKLIAPHQLSLVGKFSYGLPKMEEIHTEFKKIGFNGGYTLGLMNPRHILIRFEEEDDYQRCWIRTFWNIASFSMCILNWTLGFRFEEDPLVVSIWLSLYDLPVEFMHPEVIFSMASAIGQPLKVDTPTVNITRPSVARFCVEVDLMKDLPKSLTIGKKARHVTLLGSTSPLDVGTCLDDGMLGIATEVDDLDDIDRGSWSDGDIENAHVIELAQGEGSIHRKRGRKSKDEKETLLNGLGPRRSSQLQ
ncbi:OLC1v1008239C1 [Oldenlandia corymbosa var. corymbosa]|uniref:OLC1v1008239C1 n=1 Tax=Oldenlandia corymbosa var. corymbosa TaxID=529605 RepID=A0AAV1DNK4_OLDCO|nr:OLC1v1008239C1 [Oldenlandia corymbosa var. corymbosa]